MVVVMFVMLFLFALVVGLVWMMRQSRRLGQAELGGDAPCAEHGHRYQGRVKTTNARRADQAL